jgi:hypothetical protein
MPSIVAKFDGTKDIDEFVLEFKLNWANGKWSSEYAAQHLITRLTGKAFSVFSLMSEDDRKDANKILARLEKQFRLNRQEYVEKYKSCRPGKNELTRDFCLSLATLYDRAYPANNAYRDEELKLRLKEFLPDKFETLILVSDGKSWEDTVVIVAANVPMLNKVDSGESPIKKQLRVNFASSQSTTKNNKKDNNNSDKKGDEGSYRRPDKRFNKDIECYKCHGKGHIARHCKSAAPKPKPQASD